MNLDRRGFRGGHFLVGVLIGLVIVTPVLAMPPELPVAFDDGIRLYVLIVSGVLLLVALVMRLMRNRDDADGAAVDVPRGGMRFFPSDRPISLE